MSKLHIFIVFTVLVTSRSAWGESVSSAAGFTPKSGYEYMSDEEQALQDDDFANPGLLWVDQGRALFTSPPNTSTQATPPSCQSCHADSDDHFQGVARRFPKLHTASKELFNLERQINHCRVTYQHSPELAYESTQLLSLTAYLGSLSRGLTRNINFADSSLAEHLAAGRAYYYQRRGQLNLACYQCHELNPGQMLRGDRLSQGQATGYPAYKLEWQSLGSLHRRIRDCDVGVRAEPYAPGSLTYIQLELYLAQRAQTLTIDTPAVRR